jgi:hypothetical protein
MTDYLPPYPSGAPDGGFSVPPNPFQPTNPFQPVSDPLVSPNLSGWWQRGVAIARSGWRQLAAIQLVGVVIVLLLQTPFAVSLALSNAHESQVLANGGQLTDADIQNMLRGLALSAVPLVLSVVLTAVITLAAVHIGASVAIGMPPQVSSALTFAGRRVLPLIGWQIVAAPIYLLGLCLCVLPVLYVAAVFAILAVVVAVERTNPIGRCFKLFNKDVGWSLGRVAIIFGLSIGVGVFSGGISLAANQLGQSAASGNNGIILGSIITTLLSALITAAFGILVAPLTLAAYADMRSRVEPVSAIVIAQDLGLLQRPQPYWPVDPQTGMPFPG